jgi:hypothetical protein
MFSLKLGPAAHLLDDLCCEWLGHVEAARGWSQQGLLCLHRLNLFVQVLGSGLTW